mgnify:FL=1
MFIGCYINLCIDQIPKGESIIVPPSYFLCSKTSFTLLHCILYYFCSRNGVKKRKTTLRYPIVEILLSMLLVLIYHQYGLGFRAFAAVLIACSLVTLSFIDLAYMIIPDSINIFIASSGIFFMLMRWSVSSLIQGIVGFLIGGGTLLLIGYLAICILKKEGMGGGDIKLAAACGLCLGANKIFVAFIITGYVAGFVLLILLVLRKINKNQYIPFGPFISTGVMITVLFYENIINLYRWLL